MVVNTKQLATLLNTKPTCIKVYKSNGILENKLKESGYSIVKEFKEGRINYYVLNNNIEVNDELLFNKQVFNVQHPNFKHYYMERTSTSKGKDIITINDVVFNKDLATMTGCDSHTIKRWDDILQELQIISVDGYLYVRIQKDKITRSTREEYKIYHKELHYAKSIHSSMMFAYRKDKISKEEMERVHSEYLERVQEFANNYVARIKVYKLDKENIVHQQAIKVYTKSVQ